MVYKSLISRCILPFEHRANYADKKWVGFEGERTTLTINGVTHVQDPPGAHLQLRNLLTKSRVKTLTQAQLDGDMDGAAVLEPASRGRNVQERQVL